MRGNSLLYCISALYNLKFKSAIVLGKIKLFNKNTNGNKITEQNHSLPLINSAYDSKSKNTEHHQC